MAIFAVLLSIATHHDPPRHRPSIHRPARLRVISVLKRLAETSSPKPPASKGPHQCRPFLKGGVSIVTTARNIDRSVDGAHRCCSRHHTDEKRIAAVRYPHVTTRSH